jgi:excinuclease UvrABC nuclease subunit
MTKEKRVGIAYSPLPADLQAIEQEKARLLLEAHLLKAQMQFAEAAERFEQAARYEDKLAAWADAQGLTDLSYLHAFSALSCWAQAGDPHRALMLSRKLLQSVKLTEPQRHQVQAYYTTLEQRWVSWMQQWSTPAFVPA